MADDGKRTEMICTKLTERMAIDFLRLCAMEDRTASDFLFNLVRRELYGRMVKLEAAVGDIQGTTKYTGG